MSRVIKFRAWDNARGRWYTSPKELLWTQHGYSEPFDGTLSPYRVDTEMFCAPEEYNKYNKDRFALEQFTGLLDKNGREIYEGDILRQTYHSKYYTGRNIRNGEDVGAKYSKEETEFYSIYEVLWYNGSFDVNGHEYSILLNGWATRYIFDNKHLKEKCPPYGFGTIRPLGLPFDLDSDCVYGSYGTVGNQLEVIGNIHENPDLLK